MSKPAENIASYNIQRTHTNGEAKLQKYNFDMRLKG
jgi:hypothetical protein